MPATRMDYWKTKFKRNVERDRKNQQELRQLGWNVIVVWECELRDVARLTKRLTRSLIPLHMPYSQNLPKLKMAAEPKGKYGRDDDGN